MTEPTITEPTTPTSNPLAPSDAVLDINPLPPGVDESAMGAIAIPEYDDPLKGHGPIDLLDALQHLADASIRRDRRFNRPAMIEEAEAELRHFEARATIDGILTVTPSALQEKREQIARQQEAATRDANAEYARWSAIVGRQLVEARRKAVTLTPHAAGRPGDHMAALRDLFEQDRADAYFANETLTQLVERYARTGDDDHRAFVRAIESGRRPARSDDQDARASIRLTRLIRERQAARIAPELRLAFERFQTFTGGSRRAMQTLSADGHVRAGIK
jgi:hypothetical protein